MLSRLVVGSGPVARTILAADARPERVRVLAEDGADWTTAPVDRADPTDPGSYEHADVVLVVDQSPERTRAVARAARTALPRATIVAVLGTAATDADRAAVEAHADRVVDGGRVVAEGVLDVVAGPEERQVRALYRTLRAVGERGEGRLAVVAHDNPDPDAIASALALVRIADVVGVDAEACYYGRVRHQENRAMVNLLDLDLRRLSPEADLDEFDGFALVDHSRPGVNDQLPSDLAVDVVIDHHPPREPVEAEFVDLRSEVGATSTLLTGYLARFGVERYGGPQLATALLYGIRVDTAAFTREATAADFEAAGALTAHADGGLLERIESPSVTGETLDVLGRAIRNREVRGTALATCVGPTGDRDALAQAADRLLDLDGVSTTLVYGYDDAEEPTIYVSGRTRGTTLDLGETLRVAFDGLGSAGGHADMAGAQIPLAALGGDVLEADGPEREAVVAEVIGETFFDAVDDRLREVVDADADSYESDAEPPVGVEDGPRLFSAWTPTETLPVGWRVRDARD